MAGAVVVGALLWRGDVTLVQTPGGQVGSFRKFRYTFRLMRWILAMLLVGCGATVNDNGGHGGAGGSGGVGNSGGLPLGGGGIGGMAEGGTGGVPFLNNSCNDVCTDPLANPDEDCGRCMFDAQEAGCAAAVVACYEDATKGDCMTCGELVSGCDDGCPGLDALCGRSRQLLEAVNTCLCSACSDKGGATDFPGYMQCERPPLASSGCTDLDHTACVTTAGCHAQDGDPCPGTSNCPDTPKFAVCVATEGTPAVGACASLDLAGCLSRDDCTTVRAPTEALCCPPPVEQQAFVACVDERSPAPVACNQHSQLGDCLEAEGCRPGFVTQNGPAFCGPFLDGPTELNGYPIDWIGVCVSEW